MNADTAHNGPSSAHYLALLTAGGVCTVLGIVYMTNTRLDIDALLRGEGIQTASPPPPDPDLCEQALKNLGDLKRIKSGYEAELQALEQAGMPNWERAQWLRNSIRQLDNQISETERCFGSGPH